MILVISTDDDKSTIDVLKWLIHFKVPFERINHTDTVNIVDLNLNSYDIKVKLHVKSSYGVSKEIDLTQVKSVWYRRGYISLNGILFDEKKRDGIEERINRFLYSERNTIVDFLYSYLSDKKRYINKPSDNNINKISNLRIAAMCGLIIPNTLITNNRDKAFKFFKNTSITKALQNGHILLNETTDINYLTQNIGLNELRDQFSYSLLQVKLKKKFEIRSFYLDEKFYSMAIFSQNDPQTQTDFRNYNREKPNRTPLFKLPIQLEKKLNKFMQTINLTSGSIDLVYTVDGEFVFLEVNPIGQYSQVSYPSNFYLDKIIADYLRHYG